MYVIGDASGAEAFAAGVTGYGSEIGVKIRENCGGENRRAIFGAEDDVNEEIGEGLRHGDKDRSGFQPSGIFRGNLTQGDALGWDSVAPSALSAVGLPEFRCGAGGDCEF